MTDKKSTPLRLAPEFQNRIWGGRKLADEWGYAIPEGPVGECWAISAHPHGDCSVIDGLWEGVSLAGCKLSHVWHKHPALFGKGASGPFPLLVKVLDANDDLSVQVHPNDAYAREHENGSLGKAECWYVLSADPGARIVVGQKAHTRKELEQLVAEGQWDRLLNSIPVHAGDFFSIEPGTVHAICGGTTILETQQSSDVTYRLYDYDRRQDDGTLRTLHLKQAFDVIDYGLPCPASGRIELSDDGITTLVSGKHFEVTHIVVDGVRALGASEVFRCVSVIDGEGTLCGATAKKGDHFVIPAGLALDLNGHMQLIASSPRG